MKRTDTYQVKKYLPVPGAEATSMVTLEGGRTLADGLSLPGSLGLGWSLCSLFWGRGQRCLGGNRQSY